MIEKSNKNLLFAESLRKAISEDHAYQGHHEAYSQDDVDRRLHAWRPQDFGKHTLKNLKNYARQNSEGTERKYTLSRIKLIAEYLFKHSGENYSRWPNVIKLFKNFDGGAYQAIIRPFFSDVITDQIRKEVSTVDGSGPSTVEQILKLAVQAAREDQDKNKIIYTMSQKQKRTDQLLAEKEEILNRIREKIAKLEGILISKSEEDPSINKELQELKNKLY